MVRARNRLALLFVALAQTTCILAMASRRFGLSVAMSMLEIPLPEEDDMSDDEFDGYVDPDEASL